MFLSLEQEQIKALELGLTGSDVHETLPAGYGKSWIYHVFCLAGLFASNPKASVSDFTVRH